MRLNKLFHSMRKTPYKGEMKGLRDMGRFLFLLGLLLAAPVGSGGTGNVTYDGRSLIIDGQHKILFSGSIHYPRSTPQVFIY